MNPPKFLNKKVVLPIAGVAVVMVGMYFFLRGQKFSWVDLVDAFSGFTWKAVLLAYVADMFQVGFMMLRQGILIKGAGFKVSPTRVIRAVGTGQFINSVLPARTGDIARAVFLCKGEGGIPPASAAALIVADKVIDLVSFIVLIFASRAFLMPEFGKYSPLNNVVGDVTVVVIVIAFILSLPYLKRRFPMLYTKWLEFRLGLRGVFQWKSFGLGLGAALMVWAAEAEAIRVLAQAQDISLTWDKTFFMLCILNLFVAVPVSVGNLGTFEAAIVMALTAIGHPATESVALALAHHLLQIASVATWALVSFFIGLWDARFSSLNAAHPKASSTDNPR